MFRNYLAAAFGNLARNWFYAGITILGLSVSFAAAILIGLYLRDEVSFDRFVPDHQRVYRLELKLLLPGQKPWHVDVAPSTAADFLKLDFPEVEHVARLNVSDAQVRIGQSTTDEPVTWVDPDFFKVMRLPVLGGDPDAAMAAPDGVVLTREMARKYFGRDDVVGRTLQLNPGLDGGPNLSPGERQAISSFHPMRVMAVLEDPPTSSHLSAQLYAPARAPFSWTSMDDRHPSPFSQDQLTYVKLKPGASPETWAGRMHAFALRHYPGSPPHADRTGYQFWMEPLAALHFAASGIGPSEVTRPTGDRRVDAGVATVGVLIVVIAAINFITLMTAKATRRAVEVGVRKAVGASRRDLIVQFMGESLIQITVAMLFAMAAAELALPHLNAFLGRSLRFDYLGDPRLACAILAAVAVTGGFAGFYPALVLSGFRPAAALKGALGASSGSATVRHVLVVVQFAILIGLMVATTTIYRQTKFALHDALRLDTDQVISIRSPCRSAFAQEARAVVGVKGLACASNLVMERGTSETGVVMPDHSTRAVYVAPVGLDFFELQGLKPLAGRFFSASHGEDVVLDRPDPAPELQPTIVLNESAARRLGYADPAKAVGKLVVWERWVGRPSDPVPLFRPSRVAGVVHDFTLGGIRTAIHPTIYFVDPAQSNTLVIKLDRVKIPEAMQGLMRLWRATGHDRPAQLVFESQTVQALYKDVIVQGAVIAICSGLAILIACLGLFALAAFTTERRIKEIGVRKAMGASTFDVMRLLLWQFTKPVLWANLIAWPLAFWVMDLWLHGFAYRVDLPPWLFIAASVLAVLIAWITVSAHAFMVARAKPAAALRYE